MAVFFFVFFFLKLEVSTKSVRITTDSNIFLIVV